MLFLLLLSKCFQHLVFSALSHWKIVVFLCMKSKLCVFFCCCFLFLRHSLLCWILFHILKNLFAHKFIGMLIRFHWVPFILSFDPESVLFGWHPKLFVCALCCQLPHSCVCWSKDSVFEIQRHTQGAIFGYALHISFHISIFYCLYRCRRRHRRGRCRVVKRLQRLSLYKLKYTHINIIHIEWSYTLAPEVEKREHTRNEWNIH